MLVSLYLFDCKGLVWNCIWVQKVRPQVAGLKQHATVPGWWECHTQGRLYTTLVSTLTAKAGDRTPDPLNRQTYLLCFSNLATVTGKTSAWESKWYPGVTDLDSLFIHKQHMQSRKAGTERDKKEVEKDQSKKFEVSSSDSLWNKKKGRSKNKKGKMKQKASSSNSSISRSSDSRYKRDHKKKGKNIKKEMMSSRWRGRQQDGGEGERGKGPLLSLSPSPRNMA